MKDQPIDNVKILTIDREATREQIRIKFRDVVAFSEASKCKQSTVYALLSGGRSMQNTTTATAQHILRQMEEHGVLVEQPELQEAA